MPPAASTAPLEYGFALLVAVVVMVASIKVDPTETRWIVFAVGAVMAVTVLAAAMKPSRSRSR